MRVLVLAGGLSGEREVSLVSGSLVANALCQKGHEVLLWDLSQDLNPLPQDLSELFQNGSVSIHSFGEQLPNFLPMDEKIGENILPVAKFADCVFLALHGGIGENGTLQALFDCYGICYTGSGPVGSMLAMDKDLAKRLMRDAGVPTPEWICSSGAELPLWNNFPCVVKPNEAGSSIGVSMAYSDEEMRVALSKAMPYGRVLVERKIEGREFSIGILDGRVLPAVEIRPKQGFYDYKNKYCGETEEICPAYLTEAENQKLSSYAQRAFNALHLRGYSRLDFILDDSGEFWCLEANTLPGMTKESLLPKEAMAVGIDYPELCERILTLSKKVHKTT